MSQQRVIKNVSTSQISKAEQVVEAIDDKQALEIWYRSLSRHSVHTSNAYKRESLRFLMWLEVIKGVHERHLPNVVVDDVNNYIDFLHMPRAFPESVLERHGKIGQPIKNPLSPDSIRQAIVILHNMTEGLRNIRGSDGYAYIQMNPWRLARHVSNNNVDDEIEEALTIGEWVEVKKTIEAMPKETLRQMRHYHRTRWLFQLLYRSWLRRSEVTSLVMGDFSNNGKGWTIRLIGKGKKKARIVATSALMNELAVYRTFNGLTPLPAAGETRPVLLSLYGKDRPLTDQVVNMICREIYHQTATRLEPQNPESASRLRMATAHWMRHTGITHAMEAGLSSRYVGAQARHANPATTARYDHTDKHNWREALEQLE